MNASNTSSSKTCLCALLLFCMAALAPAAHAQKNEFAFLASSFQTSASFNVHGGEGLQLNYAHRLVDIKLALTTSTSNFLSRQDGTEAAPAPRASVARTTTRRIFTPGLKVKFAPGFPVSPYLAGGLGWGSFRSTNTSATANKFAADLGGGVDFKVFPYISLRGEVRDY